MKSQKLKSRIDMTPIETPETILEPRNSSEVSMDQSPGSPPAQESAVPAAPGCESTAEDSENQLRLFVALLTVRVLTKCHALQNCRQEEWVAHTKRLVNQTMEGLAEIQGFCPDVKNTKRVCKAVVKELQKKLCSRRLLESVIVLQDPAVDALIVQSLQAHVKQLAARPADKGTTRSIWRDVLQVLNFAWTTRKVQEDRARSSPHPRWKQLSVSNNIKFLGIHITSDLTWSMNTAHLVKKAQQRLFFLRKLKRAGLSPQLLTNFYRATIESILCLSAAVWYGSCTAQDRKDLAQVVVKTAQGIVGSPLPDLDSIYAGRMQKKARHIIAATDPTHPGNGLFIPLPSGKRREITAPQPHGALAALHQPLLPAPDVCYEEDDDDDDAGRLMAGG
ncbi:hypothetical protein L3Q82_008287 [Scortum barcoo]|uniref:Uncharacterized protein n=1 Tax=Scortum barcoo TaxID=214431 RepID=A0ACB8WHP3_9TELE|nr:hypothetical protein L3Q82_008287 [Scortum barcoo]